MRINDYDLICLPPKTANPIPFPIMYQAAPYDAAVIITVHIKESDMKDTGIPITAQLNAKIGDLIPVMKNNANMIIPQKQLYPIKLSMIVSFLVSVVSIRTIITISIIVIIIWIIIIIVWSTNWRDRIVWIETEWSCTTTTESNHR